MAHEESAGVVDRSPRNGSIRRLRPRRVKLRDSWLLVGLLVLVQAASLEALASQFCASVEITAGSNFTSEACSVIEGSLTIRDVRITVDSNVTQLLRNVVEVTDYLVLFNVSGVASLDSLLPQLSVVRGRRLLASRYAIAIVETQLVDLGLKKLVLVQRGAITIYRNVHLCLHTIDWRLLFDKAEVKVTDEANRAVEVDVYLHNNAARKLCISKSDCPSGCPNQWDWKKNDRTYYFRDSPRRLDGDRMACWNALLCQKECPKECAFACSTYELDAAHRTSAANVTCCHAECLAGCSSDGPDSCVACRNAWHAGECVSLCPAGWVRYLHRCITPQECMAMKDADSGTDYVVFDKQCVPRCSEETRADSQSCQPCNVISNWSSNVPDASKGEEAAVAVAEAEGNVDASQCVRTCSGGVISSLVQAQALTDCNVVDSSLTIRIGFDSLSIMNPDAFSVQRELKACFRRLRVIKGRLRIIRSNILTSLDFLSNLRVIEGNSAADRNVDTATDYALMVIDNENLENVWTASNETRTLQISGGQVLFQMNTNLCPDKIVAFQKAANLSHIVAIDTNGLGRTCRAEHAEDGLILEVQTVRPTVITLTWRRTLPPDVIRSEKAENHRFIGYIVYYKQYAFRNLTEADYAHTSQSSLLLGSNVKAWTSLSTGVNTVLRVTGLMPFTQYAFYVLRLASSREWTRVSDFVYERTKSARPSRPRILNDPEQLVNEANDAIAVNIRWLEPAQPNGIIQFYLIHVEKHEMQINPDIIPKQCARRATETTVDAVNRSVETVIQHDTLNNLALQCDHYEEKYCSVNRKVATELYSDVDTLPLSPVKTVVEQAGNLEAQQVSALYDEFDDLLSADMLDLHLAMDKERPRGDSFDDVLPANRSSLAMAGLIQFLESEAARANNTTIADEDTILDGSALDKDKDAANNDAFLDRLDNAEEFRRLVKERVLYVHSNPKVLLTTLRDLDIYTTYTIRVFACQNYSKLANIVSPLSVTTGQQSTAMTTALESATARIDTRNQSLASLLDITKTDSTTLSDVCSKPATLADDFTTKGITERDSIDKKSVALTVLDSRLNLRLNWRSPMRPNGLVLFYEIEITSSLKATPQLLCHPAEAPTFAGAKVEQFEIRLSQCGDYKFRLRAVSLWGPGYWTELEGYNVTCSQSTFSPELTYTLSVVLPVVAVLLTVILVSHKICKEHKRKRAAVTTVNPDYVENFYIPDEWEVPRQQVTTVRKLGAGTFGEVYEGVLHTNGRDRPGVKVAIKTMRNASLRDCSAFLEEASIMKEFTDCFHIVKLMGIVSEGQPMVLMELMSNGDLKTFLRRHRTDADDPIGRPPPSFAYFFQAAAQIADGMAYLSEKKFVHRDLAARNCLVSEDFVVKIGDFGLARDIYESDYYRKEQKGPLPIRWMAPESLTDGLFDSRTDVWAYGVVLWEMGTLGEQPYQGLSNENVLRHVRDGNTLLQPDGCDDEFYDIMRRCWARRPSDRPTFIAILQLLQPHFEYSFTTVSWYHKNCLTDQLTPGSNNHTAAQIVVHS